MVAVDDELKLLKEQVNRNIGLNLESIVFYFYQIEEISILIFRNPILSFFHLSND